MPSILSFGKSDIGLRRSKNEDAFIVKPELGFSALADGIGGAASGELASQIFLESTLDAFSKGEGLSEDKIFERVQDAFRVANGRILGRAREDSAHQGMGCTAELIAFREPKYVLGHVGDSRTYLLRQGNFRRLTRDHTLVQNQIDQGLITPVEARRHPMRNMILEAVGVKEMLAVDFIRGKSFSGDLFLLCSDGLTDLVEDVSIQEVLSLPLGLPQKGEKLIALALEAGGDDNITVVLCQILPSPGAE